MTYLAAAELSVEQEREDIALPRVEGTVDAPFAGGATETTGETEQDEPELAIRHTGAARESAAEGLNDDVPRSGVVLDAGANVGEELGKMGSEAFLQGMVAGPRSRLPSAFREKIQSHRNLP